MSDWMFEVAATPQPTGWDDPTLAVTGNEAWQVEPLPGNEGDMAVMDGGKGTLTDFDLMVFGAPEDEDATPVDDIDVTHPGNDGDDDHWWEDPNTGGDGPSGDGDGMGPDDGDGGVGDNGMGPHVYADTNRVGDTSCDADEAWQGLLPNAAPGQISPASTGNIVNVPGLGPVVQTVNWETMTVTNTTMPGHLLHPGTVSRQVIGIGGDIYIETVGWGTGTLGAANSYFANDVWTAMDLLIAIYVDQNDDGEGDC